LVIGIFGGPDAAVVHRQILGFMLAMQLFDVSSGLSSHIQEYGPQPMAIDHSTVSTSAIFRLPPYSVALDVEKLE